MSGLKQAPLWLSWSRRLRLGRFSTAALASVGWIAISGSSAPAAIVPVGTGSESADVFLNFSDGQIEEYRVSYSTPTTTGEQLMRIIDTALSSVTVTSSGTGGSYFLTAIASGSHTDGPVYIPPEGFWHYWIRDNASSPWTEAQIGAGARTIDNGYQDGWVFGSANPPVPEPGSIAGIAIASGLLLTQRRRSAVRA